VWRLPVADAAVRIEHSLRQFLLERVFRDGGFVDRNAQARASIWLHQSAFRFDREALVDDVVSPGNIVVNGLADDVSRLRKTEFQRRGRADRALRIVWCQSDSMRIGQRCNSASRGQASAMRDVELADFARTPLEQFLECRQVGDSFAGCDGSCDGIVDRRQTVDRFRPAGLFEEVQTVWIECF